ncbi:MAG: transcriptional regulator NrdR [Candidatus Sumerlaeia bacterium]|nr:transcriptional regulator NrdR [Candidatus Sumerlaeia bacterium]
MKCPVCGTPDSRVINSRPAAGDTSIRRRRECVNASCLARFTTFETIERAPLWVIKRRTGERERYDANKLRSGVEKALEKRAVPVEAIDRLVAEVENEALSNADREVSTETLGILVLRRLRALDKVAYLRFLSVYKQFCDLQDFDTEIRELMKD